MPDLGLLLVFVFAVIVISLTPGPDMLFVVANAVGRGTRAGLLSALGISSAMLVHTAAAALGLSYVFERSAWAFEVVRYVGAAYLIYLGIKALTRRAAGTAGFAAGGLRTSEIMRRGFVTNLLNPKVVVFFAAFLPQFVVLANGPVILRFLLLGVTFTILGFLVDSGIALASGGARTLLLRRRDVSLLLERIAGVVFIGLGVRLLLVRPPSS